MAYECPKQLSPIPRPPVSAASCGVPLGGSNNTILDTCCNGHVNRIVPYSTFPSSIPNGNESTYLAPNGCYLFCQPGEEELANVRSCLAGLLGGAGGETETRFRCFAKQAAKEGSSVGFEFGNDAAVGRGRGGWIAWGVFGLGVLGTLGGWL